MQLENMCEIVVLQCFSILFNETSIDFDIQIKIKVLSYYISTII